MDFRSLAGTKRGLVSAALDISLPKQIRFFSKQRKTRQSRCHPQSEKMAGLLVAFFGYNAGLT
eukprot:6703310-Prorocentrum_lima.AAC.1